jgi:hypothetical protein
MVLNALRMRSGDAAKTTSRTRDNSKDASPPPDIDHAHATGFSQTTAREIFPQPPRAKPSVIESY